VADVGKVTAMIDRARRSAKRGNHREAAQTLIAEATSVSRDGDPSRLAWAEALLVEARSLRSQNADDEALAATEVLVDALGDTSNPALQAVLLRSLLDRWQLLARRGDHDGAEQSADRILSGGWSVEEPTLSGLLAGALYAKATSVRVGGERSEAIGLLHALVDTYRDSGQTKIDVFVARALSDLSDLHGRAEDPAAAHDARRELIARFSGSTHDQIRARVALARFNDVVDDARRQSQQGQHREAAQTLMAAAADVRDANAATRLAWARLLFEQGRSLDRADDEALAATETVVHALSTDAEPALQTLLMRTLIYRWAMLLGRGELAAAEQSADRVLDGRWSVQDPTLSELQSTALYAKATTARARGEYPRAVKLLRKLVDTYRESGQPKIDARVADALWSMEVLQRAAGDESQARASQQELIARFAGSRDSGIRDRVAVYMYNEAFALRGDEPDAALALLDEIVDRFGDVRPPESPELTAEALRLALEILIERRDGPGANVRAELLAERLDPSLPSEELLNRATSIFQTVDLLRDENAADQALDLLQAVQGAFASATDQALEVLAVRAMIIGARVLTELGRGPEAIETTSEIADHSQASLIALDQIVAPEHTHAEATVMVTKVAVLREMGRTDEMGELIVEIDSRYGRSTDPLIRTMLDELHDLLADS
jgi:tetratricopeptide (TPR) repeat protein